MTLQLREETTHYCKGLLKTGKPIVVTDMVGKETTTALWRREITDKYGVTWIIEMVYVKDKKLNNSGVRVQLRVRRK